MGHRSAGHQHHSIGGPVAKGGLAQQFIGEQLLNDGHHAFRHRAAPWRTMWPSR